MTAAIPAPSIASKPATPSAQPALLSFDSQYKACQVELADWVAGPSAKTSVGQAKIAQITARMDAIKSRIDEAAKNAELLKTKVRPDAPFDPRSPLGHNLDSYV